MFTCKYKYAYNEPIPSGLLCALEDDRLYLDLIRINCGMVPMLPWRRFVSQIHGPFALETLKCTQWSPEFEQLMRNRLVMGALRYGRMNDPGKPKYDRVASIVRRAQKYLETGNQEHLVDIANEALMEFIEPVHPNAHWEAQDNTDVHTQPVGE